MIYFSIVIPVYESEESLNELHSRLCTTLARLSLPYEIIFVNDGSVDKSWQVIKELASNDSSVRGINLSRNFGQHYAITAGLDHARGEWVVVMDCDLQDLPEEIPKLYEKAQEGFDMVVGLRAERQDNFLKKKLSKLFYRVFMYFTDSKVDNRFGNFGIYAKKVIKSIVALKEQNRSFGMFAMWVGFSRAEIEINHARRPHGESSYTFRLLFRLAMDSIVAYSNKLLLLSVSVGFLLSFCSLSYSMWLAFCYIAWGSPVEGWTSLIVSIYFTAGLIIGSIGIAGLYIGKIFDEVKSRPLYIIDSVTFGIE